MTTIPADITLTSFNCPHCKVLAQQFWWNAFARRVDKNGAPFLVKTFDRSEMLASYSKTVQGDKVKIAEMEEWYDLASSGEILLESNDTNHNCTAVTNVAFSRCYACKRVACWIYDRLVHPATNQDAPGANAEMPAEVLLDYNEAAAIVGTSPRGAAALLRLAIQKLMVPLGQKGENLNDDIRALVGKGMDVRIQQSLDIVRVIGNNAVHPGQIDLKDDRQTVYTLFNLVNLIVDTMIAQPKHIEATFQGLPQSARDQIARRDKPNPS